MNKSLAELIKISNITGKDASLVQGGGGNTSVKTDDGEHMYIKASGTALKDMDLNRGWRRLRLDAVRQVIMDETLLSLAPQIREAEVANRLLQTCDDDVADPVRPSVEANLHALLDKCVIHLHPNAVGAYVNAKGGRDLLGRIFKNEKYPPMWVPYTEQGFMLAVRISKLVERYQAEHGRRPAIIFLEKHGLFVTAKTGEMAIRLVRNVIQICESKLKKPVLRRVKIPSVEEVNGTMLRIRRAFYEATGRYTAVTHFLDNDIIDFMTNRNAEKMLSAGPLTPHELVYANGRVMWVEKPDFGRISSKLTARIKRGEKPAIAFLVNKQGLFVVSKPCIAQTIRDVAAGSFFIRSNAQRFGGIAALSRRQQDFINNLEAEAFRHSDVDGQIHGELKGRIAVVTGAGSGLGRNIAIGIARAGASVVLLDIDAAAAAATAGIIAGELPTAQMLVCHCDVTSPVGVAGAFGGVLDEFGGLDIMVNAAGVAPPYSLVDLPVGEWRMSLEVNLTGYFLCAQAAARIMIAQGMGGAVVNLSSKSGLEASKNNTPYNATKAGEIHMARGWAMELGEHNIRVNSVCPGNVFEGSKIWNPQYIRTCAKKNGIKPEEVIPYYVGKTALKKEIKGQDIADSVVFLCSDRARCITGQTLVTDSGQVMVR